MLVGMAAGWSGSVVLDPGRLIYAGYVGVSHRHSHAALLVAMVISGRVSVSDAAGRRAPVTAAVLPVGAVHALHGPLARCVLAYLDPASLSGRRLARVIESIGDPMSAQTWVSAAEPIAMLGASVAEHPRDLVVRAVGELVGSDAGIESALDEHSSLGVAVRVLPQLLEGPVRLGDLAERVGVSTDRLGRLFADRLGLSFPAYVRWLRLRVAMLCVRDGATLTDAAHAAGFADSAHLTRVCREMFGMAPSVLARRIRWTE